MTNQELLKENQELLKENQELLEENQKFRKALDTLYRMREVAIRLQDERGEKNLAGENFWPGNGMYEEAWFFFDGLMCHDYGALNCAITGLGNAIQAITGEEPPTISAVAESPETKSGVYYEGGFDKKRPWFR